MVSLRVDGTAIMRAESASVLEILKESASAPSSRTPTLTATGLQKPRKPSPLAEQVAGLLHDRIERVEGLKVAIEVADAVPRWLRGERLFIAAVL
jgi:hypothetical protein